MFTIAALVVAGIQLTAAVLLAAYLARNVYTPDVRDFQHRWKDFPAQCLLNGWFRR